MPKTNTGYVWTPGGKPPDIEAHSLAKHNVFASYLKRYIEILAQNPRVSTLPITFVDGFAGGGIYRNEFSGDLHEGSPLLTLAAVKEAEFMVNQQRQASRIRTPFDVRAYFHFIDIEPSNIASLQYELNLRGHTPRIGEDVHLHTGDFAQLYQKIIDHIKTRSKNGRCIFLLDQYGYGDVPMPLLRDIFSKLHNAEVILTFATDRICHYLSEKTQTMFEQQFGQIGLSPLLVQQMIDQGQNSPQFRRIIQSHLIQPIHQASSAQFFTPFYIVSEKSNKAYWLIHLSMHPKARDVMLQEHWAHHNTFEHYGGPGLKMLGYSPHQDLEHRNHQPLPFRFEETAKMRSQAALLSQIPEMLRQHPNGIRAYDFLAEIANETPAHNDFILEVLTQLSSSKQILVRNPEGKQRREGSVVRNNDILYPLKQTIIDFQGR